MRLADRLAQISGTSDRFHAEKESGTQLQTKIEAELRQHMREGRKLRVNFRII